MDTLDLTRALYDAFARRDGAGLASLLAPDFTAHVSDGMPGGGGAVTSPAAMLALWGRVARAYDAYPRPDELAPLADGERVLALGHYVGAARSTGSALDATFAHVWRFANGRAVSLVQVTDTARWHEALRSWRGSRRRQGLRPRPEPG